MVSAGRRPDRRSVASDAKPATVGRFVLGDWLGGGGYGDVFRAFDPRLERDVALKVLKAIRLDAKATERFLREARAAAKLDHPNIVALHDAGQDGDRLWIAYRLVKGRTLAQLRDAGPWTSGTPSRSSATWPRRWTTPTPRGSRTATSSRPTSSSTSGAGPT